MSPLPHAAGRKAAAVGSLLAGAVLAAVGPTPHAHAADRGADDALTTPMKLRLSPDQPVNELVGAVTHGLGTMARG